MKAKHYSLVVLLALASSADATLVAYWKNDETSGSLIDSTGGNPPGIVTGSPLYGQLGVPNGTYGAITVTSAFGTSIEYGPSTDDEFFTVGTDNINPVMNLDANGSFTVMGWMNPYQSTLTNRSYKFLSTGSAAGADRGWGFALRLPNLDGSGASVRFTGFGIADNDSSTFQVTYNTWIHMAVTYNAGVITYFVNGNMLDSDTSVFGNETANGRLLVGSRLGGNDADQMNGLLDGIQVYDQVLTPDEIKAAAASSVSASVPEPSVAMMCAVGFLGLARRRRS